MTPFDPKWILSIFELEPYNAKCHIGQIGVFREKTELLTIENEGIGDLEVEKTQILLFLVAPSTLLYVSFLRYASRSMKFYDY